MTTSAEAPGTRRRWRFQWQPTPGGVAIAGITWFAVGMVVYITASVLTTPHGDGSNWWAFGAWLGPFAVAAVLGGLWALVCGVAWVIRHPPIKHVIEASPDIREVYGDYAEVALGDSEGSR